jgi:hypothetical protein
MEGFTGSTAEFNISPANTTAIFTGDPVVLVGGFLVVAPTTSAAILGAFNGCQYTDLDGGTQFRPYWNGAANSTGIVGQVAMPPHGMFWIKGEAGVDFAAATSVGFLHPWVANAGSVQYGDSRFTLGAPGAGAMMVHRLVDIPGNAWGTGEPILECSVNLQSATYSSAA